MWDKEGQKDMSLRTRRRETHGRGCAGESLGGRLEFFEGNMPETNLEGLTLSEGRWPPVQGVERFMIRSL